MQTEMLQRHHSNNTPRRTHAKKPERISRRFGTNLTFYQSQLQVSHDQSNKCCTCCKEHKFSRCPKITLNFFKPKIVILLDVITRYTALADMALDIRLLYKAQLSNYLFLTVTLFLSIIAPYLLQYSCGVKLFTLRRTFAKFSGFKKIFVILYLMPTGVLYFIFLDLYDLLFTVYALFQLMCCNQSTDELKNTESLLAQQLSMSRTNWAGLKRQRGVSQLMFETIPQVTIQGLLYFSVISGLELTNITSNDLLISVASALFSSVTQIIKLLFEAHAVQESFFQYSLTCFMARIGWVPFRNQIRKVLENDELAINHLCCKCCKCKCCKRNINEQNELKTGKEAKPVIIDYDIKYQIPFTKCIHKTYQSVEYDFSENTLKDLMATLMLRKQLDEDEYEWGEGNRLEINFHESLQLMSVAQLVNLLRICSERLIIIRGLNHPQHLNWKNALNVSRNLKQDTTTLKFSRDLAGRPHLMSIYLSTCRLKEFSKSVYKLPKLVALKDEREKNRAGVIASIFERNAYDFEKKPKLIHRNLPNVPMVQFNTYDDPFLIATNWVAKYMPDKMQEKRKRKITDDVTAQIIPIAKSERIEYLLRKLKLLFKIKRRKQELTMLDKNSLFADLFNTANINEPHQMTFLKLLTELRKDGYLSILSRTEEIEEIENNGKCKKCKKCFCCGETEHDSDEKYPSKNDQEEEEEDVLNILKYLDKIGEICLDFDDEKHKGIIHESRSIYEQCIQLDFDINATEVSTGESLIFTLIRKKDAVNLRKILFQYQVEKKIQINIDIHNQKGKSPLYYALREHIRDQTNNLYLLLLQANADPNFPTVKTAQVAKSPLYYVISRVHARSDKNAEFNYFYWEIINDLIYYDASLYHNEILLVSRFLIPRKMDEQFNFERWNKHYLQKMLQVCSKLQLSLATIQDERNNNPIHLLLAKFYNCNKNKKVEVKDTNESNLNLVAPKKHLDIDETVEESIKYLYKFFDGNLKWESAPHRAKDEAMVESKTDVTIESAAEKYFEQNANDIVSYLNDLIKDIDFKDNQHNDFDEKQLEEQISKMEWDIIKIMKELQRIHWKWMRFINCDDNLPITATLTEDNIPIHLLKTIQNGLDTKFKRESFVQSIRSNRFAIAIIVNYVIFQVKNLKDLKAPPLSWQVTDKYGNEEGLQKLQLETTLRQETQNYLPLSTAQNNNKSVTFTYDIDVERDRTHKNVNKFEIFYSAIVESLSVGDLLTDIIVLMDLVATNNQWWTAFMLLFLLSPYLVSFCSLASIFQSREKDVRNIMCLFLITPFSLFFLIMLDVMFMMFVVGNLIGLSLCWWNKKFLHYIDEDRIFLKFNVSHMEIKGYRRLRTLSQLVFETIPQTALQIRMFYVLNNYSQDDMKVNEEALIISIVIAFVHFCFEAIILLIESKAAQLSWFQYGVVCLNARLNWVPLLHVIFGSIENEDYHINSGKIQKRFRPRNEVNWEQLSHGSYHLSYEFCEGSFRRLYTQITRIPRFTDGSETEVKPLVTLIKQSQDVTYVQLGDQSCKFVSLRDLSRLYRNSDNRIILNGHAIDWQRKVKKQRIVNDCMVKINDTFVFDESVFGDFMQHGEVEALFAIWNGIKGEEKEKIDILALKKDSLLNDITDVRTMKRFWRQDYSFGSSCDECHIIYDRIVKYYDVMLTLEKRNKSEITTAMTRYQNMVLLMLFFTKGSIHNHRCPECNISWKDYIINKLKSEYGSISHNPYTIDITDQLPRYIKLIYGSNRVDEFEYDEFEYDEEETVKIPFILAECSDYFSNAIGEEIMKRNMQTHEPLFNTQNKNDYEEAEWIFIDDNGVWKRYQAKAAINKQFDNKHKKWEIQKKQWQSKMKYEDNLITIDLNKGEFFEHNKGKYKIIIDYHSVPPKYDQVNVENQYERTVKQFRADSALELYEKEFEQNEKSQKAVFERFKKDDLDQNCIDILSSIIQYEPDARQSFAIIKHHYDLKQNNKPSYFDKILKFANDIKLRRGYDKLLLSIERFYCKTQINTKPEKASSLIGINNIGNDILGIKQLNVEITIYNDVTETKSQNVDEDHEYVIPIRQMPTELGTIRGVSPKINFETEEIADSIDCQLWLKIPPDLDKKQIESWNDILLKTITIDLEDSVGQYQKLIAVNLSEHYTSLGSFSPKLFNTNKLEFEVKINVDEEENYDQMKYNALINSAEVVLITNKVHNPDVIEEIDEKFWIEHQAVQWKWQDEKEDLQKYDRLSNKQIEQDYQKLKKMAENKRTTLIIPITDGVWINQPKNKNKYQIRIVRLATPHLYYQVNIASGSTRIVQREIIGWKANKHSNEEKQGQSKNVKFYDEIKQEENDAYENKEIDTTQSKTKIITPADTFTQEQSGNNNITNEAALAFHTQTLKVSMSNIHTQQSLSPTQNDDNIEMPEVSEFID